MKNLGKLLVMLLFLASAIVFASTMAMAQDPMKVAPNNYKVLLENDRVRVLEVRANPGEKIAMHSHPAHVLYFFKSSTVKFTFPDGKTQEINPKAGDVIYGEPFSHAAEALGFAEVQVLIVELKEPAKKMEEKK